MTIDIGWTTNTGKCKTLNTLNFQHLKYHDLTFWVGRVVTNQNLYSPSLYLPTAPLLEDAGYAFPLVYRRRDFRVDYSYSALTSLTKQLDYDFIIYYSTYISLT